MNNPCDRCIVKTKCTDFCKKYNDYEDRHIIEARQQLKAELYAGMIVMFITTLLLGYKLYITLN